MSARRPGFLEEEIWGAPFWLRPVRGAAPYSMSDSYPCPILLECRELGLS